ncbi:MAG: hypothetical protein HY000_24270 [Planctomycetes bacterium]|nr:hypothetical protein [Planctomycetota bacterium]
MVEEEHLGSRGLVGREPVEDQTPPADQEIAADQVSRFDSVEEMLDSLRRLT